MLAGLAILIVGFIVLSLTLTGFLTWINLFTALFLAASLVFTTIASRAFGDNRSAFIGLMVLGTIFVVASLHVEGFLSGANIKSMLVFAAFLGLATVGQTLVALLGGLDLSIPFLIGSSNVGLLYLIGLGIPSPIAVILVLVAGAAIGFLNGLLSFPLQGQALIVTLGVGFATSGLTQILTSIGSSYAGNVYGQVPAWLSNLAAMNGVTFGIAIPPVIFVWIAVAIALDFRPQEHGLRPLSVRARRQPDVGAAHPNLGAALLVWRLYDLRLLLDADRVAASGVERRRLHRGRRPLPLHDAGRGRHRRNVPARRTRRLRFHRDRRSGASGADRFPRRHRSQVRVAAIHLRSSDSADGRALCALAAYPDTNLGDSSVTNETATTRPPQTRLRAEGGRP